MALFIAGNSVRMAPSEEETPEGDQPPPMGFRLFGQRFVFDSHIFHVLTNPRIPYDRLPQALEVMSVFGSTAAEKLLFSVKKDYYPSPAPTGFSSCTFIPPGNICGTKNSRKIQEGTISIPFAGAPKRELLLPAIFSVAVFAK